MKILHVTSSLDPRGGGVAEALRQLAPALVRQGHRTEIATLDTPGSPWLAAFPAPVHPLGPARTSYQYAARLAPWLRAHRGEFDCVISHGMWQHHGFAAWRHWRGPRFVYTHGMLDPWFARAYPRKHLKKWLYWPWAEYRILRSADAVFFTCEEERRLARESFWLYRAREAISPLGIEEPPGDAATLREKFHAAFPGLRDRRTLLFLGRIAPKKGCDLLLRAFEGLAANHPDAALVMAGPGEPAYLDELKRLVPRSGAAVHWPGMVTGDLKWGALHAAEAFVLPSHQENFGLAVVEALACARPVLISDKVNIWREIQADGAGLVDTDDEAGTARLLGRWLDLPGGERATMCTHARACYEHRFQIDRATARLVEQLRHHGVKN